MKRVNKVSSILKKQYPDARISLDFSNKFELLVAVILSAQCTDARVNIVTKNLFKLYRNIADYARADTRILERYIRSCGFYHNKARSIIGCARLIIKDFSGRVPGDMVSLLKLPGIARKSANVILFNGFRKQEGIAVDTHVIRLSGRLKLSSSKDPKRIEQDLMRALDKSEWGVFSLRLITHGRKVCVARNPKCSQCCLRAVCPSRSYFERE